MYYVRDELVVIKVASDEESKETSGNLYRKSGETARPKTPVDSGLSSVQEANR